MQLTAAYRSLSRPSSAPDAKAFPLRSSQLDLLLRFGSLELCRQFYRIFEIVIVTHLYDVPQLKLFVLPDYCLKDLSVALLITFFALFSFQGAAESFTTH